MKFSRYSVRTITRKATFADTLVAAYDKQNGMKTVFFGPRYKWQKKVKTLPK
jgi:predicted nucleic-acid-binding protein